MRTWIVLAPFLLVVAACTLPSRDSAFDPANAPNAQLRVVAVPEINGACPAYGSWPEVFSTSRGACIALDASASTDPQDSEAAKIPLTYAFAVVGSCGSFRGAIASTGAIVVLSDEFRLACPRNRPIVFSAAVSDGHASSETTASVLFENAAPIAVTNPSRSLPVGGYPWSPGVPYTVRFSGRGSSDPDGDDLEYCFTLPGVVAPVCSADADDPAFSATLPSTRRTAIATLHVYDNPLPNPPGEPDVVRRSSLPATTTVVVREPNLWAVARSGVRTERLDVLATDFGSSLIGSVSGAVFLPSPAGDHKVVFEYAEEGTGDLYLARASWPDLTIGAQIRIDLSTGDGPVAFAPSTNRIWAMNDNPPGGTCPPGSPGYLRSFDPATLQELSCTGVDVETPDFPGGLLTTASGVWIALPFQFNVRAYGPTGTPGVTIVDPARFVTGSGVRPGTDEVWVAYSPDIASLAAPADVVIHVLTDPMASPQVINVDASMMLGLAWIDHNRFWSNVAGAGLSLIDASALEEGASIQAATLLEFPAAPDPFTVFAEQATGICWAASSDDTTTYRALPNGLLEPLDTGEFFPFFADPDGALWFSGTGFARGLTPSRTGVVQTVSIGSTEPVQFDFETGGVWGASIIPRGLLELGETGEVLRFLPRVVRDGVEQSTPLLIQFRAVPGEAVFWGLVDGPFGDPLGIGRVDARNPGLPVFTMVAGSSFAIAAANAQVLEPSAPIAGTSPFVWTIQEGATWEVMMVSSAGTQTLRASFPLAEVDGTGGTLPSVFGARSLETNRLCVATLDDTQNLRVRSVPPTGPEAIVLMASLPALTTLSSSAASGSLCWVAMWEKPNPNDPTTWSSRILAFDLAGSVVRDHTETGSAVLSIAALGPDEVWVTALDSDSAVGNSLPHLKIRLTGYVPGGGFQERRAFKPTIGAMITHPASAWQR